MRCWHYLRLVRPVLQPKQKTKEASPVETEAQTVEDNSSIAVLMSPAAKKLIEENSLVPNTIKSTGKDGRVTKEDVLKHLEEKPSETPSPAPSAQSEAVLSESAAVRGARAEEKSSNDTASCQSCRTPISGN